MEPEVLMMSEHYINGKRKKHNETIRKKVDSEKSWAKIKSLNKK